MPSPSVTGCDFRTWCLKYLLCKICHLPGCCLHRMAFLMSQSNLWFWPTGIAYYFIYACLPYWSDNSLWERATLGCFHLGAIMENAAMNTCMQVFVWTHICISLGYIVRSGIAGHIVTLCLTFWGTVFSKWLLHFILPLSKSSDFSISLWTIITIWLFDSTILVGVKKCLLWFWFTFFLVADDDEHPFIMAICVFSLEKRLFKSFAHFKLACISF